MREGWRDRTLGEFMEFNPRESIRKGEVARKVAMDCLMPFQKTISSFTIDQYKGGTKFKNGDTLLARITPCLENGKTAFVDILDDGEIAFGSTEYIVLREKSDVSDRNFIYYLSTSPFFRKVAISAMTGSSGRQRVQTDVLKNHEFLLPPIYRQRAIGKTLSGFDQKIHLLTQQNATLESLAQTLFKSWFVDFDPVIDRMILAGKELPEALHSRGERRRAVLDAGNYPRLPREVMELFPEEFTFSEELGKWVPLGWEVEAVNKAIVFNPRLSLKKGKVARFADMKALPTSGYCISGVIDKEYKGGAKFQQDDVLLARITPCLENGKTGVVDFLARGDIGFGSTEFIVMRENKNITMPFVASLAREENFVNYCIQNMVGSSGRQRVQQSCFDHYFIAVPSGQILSKFDSVSKHWFKKASKNQHQIRTLTQTRDTLLPKLISGELAV